MELVGHLVCKRTKIDSVSCTGGLNDYLLLALMLNKMRTKLLRVGVNTSKCQYLYNFFSLMEKMMMTYYKLNWPRIAIQTSSGLLMTSDKNKERSMKHARGLTDLKMR